MPAWYAIRMTPLHRFSLVIWLLLKHLPPISRGRLLMPLAFLLGWTVLRAVGVSEPAAFVWAAVLAQAVHVWAVLPVTVRRQRRAFRRAGRAVGLTISAILGLMAFQVWFAEPWLSQRLLTLYCAIYAAIMALGAGGDRVTMDHSVPVPERSGIGDGFRRHLLRLYAIVALSVIAINETLLAVDAALNTRVIVLSLTPVVLHYFFEIAMRLTSPSPGEDDA